MQVFTIACFAAACTMIASSASAEVRVSVKRANYDIVGKSGVALLRAMDRKGPRHGLLTRAIAQTGYTVGWDIKWTASNGVCRVRKATAKLSITYTFPRVASNVSPDLKRRWARFIAGVQKHEERHGAIARQMVNAAERSVSGLSTKRDPTCSRSQAEVKRRVEAIYAEYEARQVRFDAREHGEGGNVEKLVAALVKNG
jgi:predicted secreted Zn-dependent protease